MSYTCDVNIPHGSKLTMMMMSLYMIALYYVWLLVVARYHVLRAIDTILSRN